jgi:RNA polymerase sigma-70 factor (ECF subfamily)
MTAAPMPTTDNERFNELMQATYHKVYRLAYRLSSSRTDAEDLTQEAFLRAFRSFDSYQGDKPFENWIFRIVTRLYLDLRRRRARRVNAVSFDAPLRLDGVEDSVQFETADGQPSAEDALLQSALSEKMESSLSQLSEDQRRLVWMADVMQIPYKEIAEEFDAPVGTIRSRLHRAHKQLRRILSRMAVKGSTEPCPNC